MRKKRFIISIITLITILFFVFIFHRKKSINENGSDDVKLPEISALAYDGSLFELDKLEKVKKTIVFFFSPECDHCEEEIDQLLKRPLLEDKDDRWLFITMDVLKDELEIFLKTYPIEQKSNVFVLLDSGLYYHNLFEVTGSPSVFIFDETDRLVHKIIGGFNINLLTQWL